MRQVIEAAMSRTAGSSGERGQRSFRVLAIRIGVLGALGVLALSGTVLATPGSGVTTKALATVTGVDPIDVKVNSRTETASWKLKLSTTAVSDVHVLEHTLAPGATFGWHSHPGPSLVFVKAGTLSRYSGADPTCTAQLQPAGSTFVEDAGTVHVARNEGAVDVVLVQTSLVPAGAARRIDQPAPGNCGF